MASSTASETRNPKPGAAASRWREPQSELCAALSARCACHLRVADRVGLGGVGVHTRLSAIRRRDREAGVLQRRSSDRRVCEHLPTPMSAFAMTIAQANHLLSDARIRYKL